MRSRNFCKAALGSVAVLMALWLPLGAQQIDYNSLRSIIRLNAPEKISASRSQAVTVDVVASLKAGYHLNSNVSPTYPLKIVLADNGSAVLQNVVYPSPKLHSIAGETLSVFDGDIKLKLTFKVAATAPVGRTILTSKISYQACDDRACLRPDNIELKLPLDVRN